MATNSKCEHLKKLLFLKDKGGVNPIIEGKDWNPAVKPITIVDNIRANLLRCCLIQYKLPCFIATGEKPITHACPKQLGLTQQEIGVGLSIILKTFFLLKHSNHQSWKKKRMGMIPKCRLANSTFKCLNPIYRFKQAYDMNHIPTRVMLFWQYIFHYGGTTL